MLERRVEYDKFLSWFWNNPDQKTHLILLLDSMGRKFPKNWEKIINSLGLNHKPKKQVKNKKTSNNTQSLKEYKNDKKNDKVVENNIMNSFKNEI